MHHRNHVLTQSFNNELAEQIELMPKQKSSLAKLQTRSINDAIENATNNSLTVDRVFEERVESLNPDVDDLFDYRNLMDFDEYITNGCTIDEFDKKLLSCFEFSENEGIDKVFFNAKKAISSYLNVNSCLTEENNQVIDAIVASIDKTPYCQIEDDFI